MRSETENRLEHILIKCITACESCASECMDHADVADRVDCIKQNLDCAAICSLATILLARQSKYLQDILEICIKSCSHCAKTCNAIDDEYCQQCAKICEECVEACDDFINGASAT